jgi:hypothetical protein
MLCNACILTLTFLLLLLLLEKSLCRLKLVMNSAAMCHGCMFQWIVNLLILLVELNSVALYVVSGRK